MTVGMEHLKRGNVFVLNFLCLYGMVLGQYMQCPAGDWTVGSTVTLRCYLPKNIYPARCTNAFSDVVTFYKLPLSVANTKCTLSSVSTSSCSSSSSNCSCESGNSTHYSLQSTFTVDTEDDGTWKCTVNCFDASLAGQLTYASDNCDDKNVVEPTTEPPTTAASPTTPAPMHHCKFCEFSNCKDTGGCWGCILLIVIIIIVCLVILGICSCYCCCQTAIALGCIYTCIDSCLGKKKSPTINATTAKPDEKTTSLTSSPSNPPSPNCTKKGKQTAEKSDMNELRDIPSSPDQDEKSHPWKGSRDLPQPRAGGGGQGNVTHSSTPRSLLPVQAVTPLPSVERNSYAESRKLPLPSIDSKDAH